MELQDDTIIEAVGLQNIILEKTKYSKEKLTLEIFCQQDRTSCRCHQCDNLLGPVHEWKRRVIRGPPVGAFCEVIIHLKQLRAHCYFCDDQVRSAKIDFVHPYFQNLTLALCEHAGRLMEEITCAAVARLLRLNSKTMWDFDQWRMKKMKSLLELPNDLDLTFMSADEVHFRSLPKKDSITKREIKFATNLVCYKESKVLSNAMGRAGSSLKNCLNILTEPQRLAIHFFAVDMHDPFISIIKKFCPNAQICVDRFHLAQKVNDTFDDLRKAEFKLADAANDKFQLKMLAPHRRFVLVEREKKLKKSDLKMLDQLKKIIRSLKRLMLW